MRGSRIAIGITTLVALVPAAVCAAADRPAVDPRVMIEFAALPSGATLPVWVVFADKGIHDDWQAAPPRTLVSERSLQRRRKVRPESGLVDAGDVPVDEAYVAAVARSGAKIRQRSKWLNRVSVEATAPEITAIAALPCVRAVEPLARFRRRAETSPDVAAPDAAGQGLTIDDRDQLRTVLHAIAANRRHDVACPGDYRPKCARWALRQRLPVVGA